MIIKLFIYCVAVLVCTFAVSGINFSHFIKQNHVWEARFLAIIFILSLSYIFTNFIYDIVTISSF